MEQKKLYRSEKNKMLMGVCAGFADYFNLDPTIVRVLFVVFGICAFMGVIAYIIFGLIIPVNPYE